MTVVSLAAQDPVAGCGLCRQNAVFWNRERRSLAKGDLAEAASLVGTSPAVGYMVAAGRPVYALGEAADRTGADVIVLPWEPSGRLRRLFSSTVAERLRRSGRWQVIVAPAATPQSDDDSRLGTETGVAGA